MKEKKQVNVELIYRLTFFPEDLGLDDSTTRTALMDYADVEVNKIIHKVAEHTDMMPDEINVEVCELMV